MPNNPGADIPAYSVEDFCDAHSISRGKLYELWKNGNGPARMKVGRRTLISAEAAREWRAQLTAEGPDRNGGDAA